MRITYLLLLILTAGQVMAQVQDTATKKANAKARPFTQFYNKAGAAVLPEKGDWAIGLDAVPVFNYIGRMLSDSGAGSPAAGFTAGFPMSISGKYFSDHRHAYRARLRVGIVNQTEKNSVVDIANSSLDTVYLQDTRKHNATNIYLSLGKEYRKGWQRIQGFYGGELGFMFTRSKINYQYANSFTNVNPSVPSTDFSTTSALGYEVSNRSSRIKADNSGTGIGLGLRGFIGAEYFIFPKMSLGFEFGWGLSYFNQNDGELIFESWDNTTAGTKTRRNLKAGMNRFGIDTDNNGGSLFFHFYF
jgi:hypothetical protein